MAAGGSRAARGQAQPAGAEVGRPHDGALRRVGAWPSRSSASCATAWSWPSWGRLWPGEPAGSRPAAACRSCWTLGRWRLLELPVPKQVDSKTSMLKKGRNWVISASGGVAIRSWELVGKVGRASPGRPGAPRRPPVRRQVVLELTVPLGQPRRKRYVDHKHSRTTVRSAQLRAVAGTTGGDRSQLEEGQLGLDEALARYKRASSSCGSPTVLEQAERRIELLGGLDAEGNPITRPPGGRVHVVAWRAKDELMVDTLTPAAAEYAARLRPQIDAALALYVPAGGVSHAAPRGDATTASWRRASGCGRCWC